MDTEVVVFEIKVADVAADLKRVGLRASWTLLSTKSFQKSCWFGILNIHINGLDDISVRARALMSILDAWISWTLPTPTWGVTLEGPCPHKRTLYGSCPRKRNLGGYCPRKKTLIVLVVGPRKKAWSNKLSCPRKRTWSWTWRTSLNISRSRLFLGSRQASFVNHTFHRLTFFRCPRFTNLARKFTITNTMTVTIIVIIQNINQFITFYTKFEIRWHHVIYT